MDQFLILLFIVCLMLLQVLSRALKNKLTRAGLRSAEAQAAAPERAWPAVAEPFARIPPRAPSARPDWYHPKPVPDAISRSAPQHPIRLRLAAGEGSATMRAPIGDKASLKRAVILMTILGPPRAHDPP